MRAEHRTMYKNPPTFPGRSLAGEAIRACQRLIRPALLSVLALLCALAYAPVRAFAQVPTAPMGVTATRQGSQASISWTPVTGSQGYNVKRSTFSGGPYSTVASVLTGPPYVDGPLAADMTYYYVVSAFGPGGEGPDSASAVTFGAGQSGGGGPGTGATPILAINCGGPAAGTFVADTDYSSGTVYTTTAASIDVSQVASPGPQDIYKSERYGSTSHSFTYTLPGLTPGGAYTIRLHFVDYRFAQAGQRLFNVTFNGMPALTNFDVVGTVGGKYKAITRDLTGTADGTGKVVLFFTGSPPTNVQPGEPTYSDPEVNAIEVFAGAAGSGIPVPPVITSVVPGNRRVALAWSPVSGATGYTVYRMISGSFVPVSSAPSAGYTDTGLTNGTSYQYAVTAVNASGESARSAAVSATPVAAPLSLATFTLDKTQIGSGERTFGTVTLSGETSSPVTVNLTSSNISAVSLPGSVQIAAGAATAKFSVTGNAIPASAYGSVTAQLTASCLNTNLNQPLTITAVNNLHLTQAGIDRGFTLTTFESGIKQAVGSAYLPDGTVMVANGSLYKLPDQDNQVTSQSTPIATIGGLDCLRVLGSSVFVGDGNGVLELNYDGTSKRKDSQGNPIPIFTTSPSMDGIEVDPRNGHLIIARGGDIIDVDPKASQPVPKVIVSSVAGQRGYGFDGMTVSEDGSLVFGADQNGNQVLGFHHSGGSTEGALAFQYPIPNPGSNPLSSTDKPDGMAIGRGNLSNYLFVNTTGGNVYEFNLIADVDPVTHAPIPAGTPTLIATGGSYGDFIGYGSHGTLLLSQINSGLDRIMRLTPPPGSSLGGDTAPIFTRDDQNTNHAVIAISGSELTNSALTNPAGIPVLYRNSSDAASYDTQGIAGSVTSAHMQRAGQSFISTNAIADLQPGLAAVNGSGVFGLPTSVLTTPAPYLASLDLSPSFLTDISSSLGSAYSATLSDSLSTVCGDFIVSDTPGTQGFDKNLLTLVTSSAGGWPGLLQGRSQDVTISDASVYIPGSTILNPNAELPLAGNWDIVWRHAVADPISPTAITVVDTVVASSGLPDALASPAASAGQSGVWNVEPDNTTYRGVIVSVPAGALPSSDPASADDPLNASFSAYRVRFLRTASDGTPVSGRGYFHVIPAGTLPATNVASVLQAITLSVHPVIVEAALNAPVSTGTLTLDKAAPAGGAVITLTSSNPQVAWTVPSVTIPAGHLTATFPIYAVPPSNLTEVGFTASYNGFRQVWLIVASEPIQISINPTDPVTGSPVLGAPTGGSSGSGPGGDPAPGSGGGPIVLHVPGKPTGLVATPGDGFVTLQWTAPIPQPNMGNFYAIARADDVAPDASNAGDAQHRYHFLYIGTPQTSYLDTAVQNGTTYAYIVFTVYGPSFSMSSNVAHAMPIGPTLAPPTITPSSGTFIMTANVEIDPATGAGAAVGSVIRYTIDGTDPSESSPAYTGGFNLTQGGGPSEQIVTIKAQAYKTGSLPSTIATATLTITPFVAPATTSLDCGDNVGTLPGSGQSYLRGQIYTANHYSLAGTAGQHISLTLTADFPVCLYLLDGAGNVIASAGDTSPNGTAVLSTTLPATATYVVEATSFYPHQTGPYTLTLPCAPELVLSVDGHTVTPGQVIDFGTTPQGMPVSKTFTVTNVGPAPLNLSSITPPTGFVASSFSASSLPAGGTPPATATFSLGLAGSATGMFNGPVSIISDDPQSPYQFTATGVVTPLAGSPDFQLAVSPGTFSLAQGGTGPDQGATITVTPLNGFQDTVGLSVTEDDMSSILGNPTVDPTKIGYSITPASVTPSGAPVAATLTFTVGSSVPTGTYNLIVHGDDASGGNISHLVPITLTVTPLVPDFSVMIDNAAPTVVQGDTGQVPAATLTVSPVDGFQGNVALNLTGLPSGITATLNPSAVALTGGGAETSTLSFQVDSTVAPGIYDLTLTGTAGGLVHPISLILTVSKPVLNFDLTAASTGSGKITLYWNGVPDAIGYNIYRGTTAASEDYANPVNGSTPVTNLDTGPGVNNMFMYSNTGLIDGMDYFYTVKAVYASAESEASNEDDAIPDSLAVPWDTFDPVSITRTMTAQLQTVLPADTDPDTGEYITPDVGLLAVQGPDGVMYEDDADNTQPVAYASPAQYDSSHGTIVYNDGTVVPAPPGDNLTADQAFKLLQQFTSLSPLPRLAPLRQDLNYDFGPHKGIAREVMSQKGFVGMSADVVDLPSPDGFVHLEQTGGRNDTADIYTGGTVNGGFDLDIGLWLLSSDKAIDPGWEPFAFDAAIKSGAKPVAQIAKPIVITVNGQTLPGNQRVLIYDSVSMSFVTGGSSRHAIQDVVAVHFKGSYQIITRAPDRTIVDRQAITNGPVTVTAWSPGWNYDHRSGMVIKRINTIAQNIDDNTPEVANGDYIYLGAWGGVKIQSMNRGIVDWDNSLDVTRFAGGHPYPDPRKVFAHTNIPYTYEDHINLSATDDILLSGR